MVLVGAAVLGAGGGVGAAGEPPSVEPLPDVREYAFNSDRPAEGYDHCYVDVLSTTPEGFFEVSSERCFRTYGEVLAEASGGQIDGSLAQPFSVTALELETSRIIGSHYDLTGIEEEDEPFIPPDSGESFSVVGGPCNGGGLDLYGNDGYWNNRVSSTANGCPVIRHYDEADPAPGIFPFQPPVESTFGGYNLETGGNLTTLDDRVGAIQYFDEVTTEGRNLYVAIGDSTTTGHSIPECDSELSRDKHGCDDSSGIPATPYPELVAQRAGPPYDDLNRVGVWGTTLKTMVEEWDAYWFDDYQLAHGSWVPQLVAAEDARQLVTVSIGANDMHFSDVYHWAWQFRTGQSNGHANDHLEDLDDELDVLFNTLDIARDNGADIVVANYFNPYGCGTMHAVADSVIGNLNEELESRTADSGFLLADFHEAFQGHSAGDDESWVFGYECSIRGVIEAFGEDGTPEVQARFDPHPNGLGTNAQANAVLEVLP